jgi:hypothetical protein
MEALDHGFESIRNKSYGANATEYQLSITRRYCETRLRDHLDSYEQHELRYPGVRLKRDLLISFYVPQASRSRSESHPDASRLLA